MQGSWRRRRWVLKEFRDGGLGLLCAVGFLRSPWSVCVGVYVSCIELDTPGSGGDWVCDPTGLLYLACEGVCR